MKRLLILIPLLALAACSDEPEGMDPAVHRADVQQWRSERVQSLTSENGWLTLVGLCWLERGSNSFGSADNAACKVDYDRMPALLGSFELRRQRGNFGVMFIASGNATVTHDGEPVTRKPMVSDQHDNTTVLAHDSLRFYLIERFGELGVRVRDTESPARREFKGMEYFPIDLAWRKVARFEPWPEPRGIPIINILGMRDEMRSPGQLVFEHDGREYRLTALAEANDPRWFVMVADETSGRTSYGAGRYIYVDAPYAPYPEPQVTVLDFNKVYNPPCAFTALATCPLPPMSNRLPLAITAGEKIYESEDAWKSEDMTDGE